MKAVEYEGPRKMAVADRPRPKITSPTDALLRVTTSGICGSDLHMYDGRTDLKRYRRRPRNHGSDRRGWRSGPSIKEG